MNLNETITNVVLTKACSISPDNESKKEGVSKLVNIKVNFNGATLQSVFDKAVSATVIQWQNGPGRSKFDEWKANQTIEIDFKAPARTTVDPMDAIIAQASAAGMTVEQYVIEQLKKRN